MLKAAIFVAAIPALIVVAAAGLVLLPLVVLVRRLDRPQPPRSRPRVVAAVPAADDLPG